MRIKIGIIGPSEAGKTTLANLLSNENVAENNAGGHNTTYRPTDSVRIVELTIPNFELKKYSTELDIQLWEIGGNPKLKSIWPAVQHDLDGVIIVYNVHNEIHIKDCSALHMHFVTHSPDGLTQCFIVGNTFRGMREIGPQRILGVSKRVRHIAVNLEDDSNTKVLLDEFMQFMSGVAQTVHGREKANLVGSVSRRSGSKKLTAMDRRNESLAMATLAKVSKQKRSISTAINSTHTDPNGNVWKHPNSATKTSRQQLDRTQTALNFNNSPSPNNNSKYYEPKSSRFDWKS